ncbi:hypothetical protein BGX38DRAFT_1180519 [Terfezia claveryi]|nr:hypothetical protein BGX38DRAFT_1180519 [Terfezia claveryi]
MLLKFVLVMWKMLLISGVVNPILRVDRRAWSVGFEAAHISSLNAEKLWIKEVDDTNGVSKINSPQNGMLLRSDIHHMLKSIHDIGKFRCVSNLLLNLYYLH